MTERTQIIDVYGDGSLIVEGKIGDLVSVPLPEHLLSTPIGGNEILPWANDLLKVGLRLTVDSPHNAIFQVIEV